MRIRRLDLALVWVVAAVFFALQANTLRLDTRPQTEEGMHAEAGRMILEGWMPYRDFLLGHPPVLALLLGLGLKVSHSMYPIRLLYLFVNCVILVLLYRVVERIGRDRLAAFLAVVFYATCPGLAEWDFRYVTIRPLVNVLLILFLYIGVVHPGGRYGPALQAVLSILSALTFYPAWVNLLFASGAMIAAEPAQSRRRALARRYTVIGLVTVGVVLLFWVSIPGSFQTTVLARLRAPVYGGLIHRLRTWIDQPQFVMYPLGFASLLGGAILIPHLRPYSLAMAGIVAMSFATREFAFYYFGAAGPALAFGAGTIVLLLRWLVKDRRAWLAYSVGVLVLGAHLATTLPILLTEWRKSRPDYHALVHELRSTPEPMLTFMQPIYAVDADRRMVTYYYRAAFRVFAAWQGQLSDEEYDTLASRACTIFLSWWDLGFVPRTVQQRWRARFQAHEFRPFGTLLITGHPHCAAVSLADP